MDMAVALGTNGRFPPIVDIPRLLSGSFPVLRCRIGEV
jgi:hypothetical protein